MMSHEEGGGGWGVVGAAFNVRYLKKKKKNAAEGYGGSRGTTFGLLCPKLMNTVT